MEIKDIVIYKGRNIYSHKPTMKMIVDIGKYSEIPTKNIDGFNEKLLNAFPNLKSNTCGLGFEGGFLVRLNEGTYLAHVLEHVILDIQNTVGCDVKYGRTRVTQDNAVYNVVYEYENEVTGLECAKTAVFILNSFLNNEEIGIEEFINYLRKVDNASRLGPSTSAIANEAKKRKIPVTRIGNDSLIQLNYGRLSRLVQSTLSDTTSCICADIASNKQLTKTLLSENKIPVPYGKTVYSLISAIMAANQIGTPVVIKPSDSNQGKGVHLNLKTEEEISLAFKEASKYSNGIIVEKYIEGKDYRVLVVGGKVSAVSKRLPAQVEGNGRNTIRELVDIVNKDSNRGENHEKALTKIKLDSVALNILKNKGLDENYIPKAGEKIILRGNANLSTGGTAVDCTDIIHPDNAKMAIRAAEAIGIDIAGIDFVANDISQSILETGGAVVEVNPAPGIRMHLYPSVGHARNVAKDIVDFLYPPDMNVNFPIVSVTGTNGKTTTVRLISHILSLTGKNVGFTSTGGTYVNNRCICMGDNSGPLSAKALLSNKTIDAAVLETARGGIIRQGLGYDLADVGVITNISDDHLGIDSVDTISDLTFVKALVIEAIKPNGYAVLNADDKMTDYLLKRVNENVVLFGKNKDSFNKYNRFNYIKIFVENGFIKIVDNEKKYKLTAIRDIPITLNGTLEFNIENCLAATGALYALNVPVEVIDTGLVSFKNNNGRFNIFEVNDFKVILDYAHNKSGYESVIKALKSLSYERLIGIIGMPGDRTNESIRSVGKLCANAFDKIFIKEDIELRGRKKGEVANIIKNSISEISPNKETEIFENEAEALKKAISEAENNDLIILFYEKYAPSEQIIIETLKNKTLTKI